MFSCIQPLSFPEPVRPVFSLWTEMVVSMVKSRTESVVTCVAMVLFALTLPSVMGGAGGRMGLILAVGDESEDEFGLEAMRVGMAQEFLPQRVGVGLV